MREAVYTALFNKILASPGIVGQFKLTSRFLRAHWEIAPEQMPALFMIETGEEWARPGRGIPPKRTLQCNVVLYVYSAGPEDTLPATLCNAVLDAIDDAVTIADNPENVVTLGGLVYHVYIEGQIKISEGLLQNVSIVDVPIRMLLP